MESPTNPNLQLRKPSVESRQNILEFLDSLQCALALVGGQQFLVKGSAGVMADGRLLDPTSGKGQSFPIKINLG